MGYTSPSYASTCQDEHCQAASWVNTVEARLDYGMLGQARPRCAKLGSAKLGCTMLGSTNGCSAWLGLAQRGASAIGPDRSVLFA